MSFMCLGYLKKANRKVKKDDGLVKAVSQYSEDICSVLSLATDFLCDTGRVRWTSL